MLTLKVGLIDFDGQSAANVCLMERELNQRWLEEIGEG